MKLHWLLLGMVPACMTAGDRAQTGECPVAHCSSNTPNGLLFEGTSFADGFFTTDGPQVTAIGGAQQIDLFVNATDQPALTLPYHALGGSAVDVTTQSGSTILVTGVAPGESELQIVDPSGNLYDQTSVMAAHVDAIAIGPASFLLGAEGPTVWAAAPQKLAIQLTGTPPGVAAPARLVDTTMTVTTELATAQPAWDELDVLEAPAAGEHAITVTAGDHAAVDVPFTVVDHADLVEAVADADALSPGTSTVYCYAARNAGRFILGAPWIAHSTNGTITGPAGGDACFVLAPDHAGGVHVELSTLGATASFDYTTGATPRASQPAPAPRRVQQRLPGERAQFE